MLQRVAVRLVQATSEAGGASVYFGVHLLPALCSLCVRQEAMVGLVAPGPTGVLRSRPCHGLSP